MFWTCKLLQAPRHAAAHFLLGKRIVLDGVGPDQVNALVGQDGQHVRLLGQFFERAGRHLHGDGRQGAGADRSISTSSVTLPLTFSR